MDDGDEFERMTVHRKWDKSQTRESGDGNGFRGKSVAWGVV